MCQSIKCTTEILILIAYAQSPLRKVHSDETSKDVCIHFSMGLYLHPYFEYAISEGSGKSAQMTKNNEF